MFDHTIAKGILDYIYINSANIWEQISAQHLFPELICDENKISIVYLISLLPFDSNTNSDNDIVNTTTVITTTRQQ